MKNKKILLLVALVLPFLAGLPAEAYTSNLQWCHTFNANMGVGEKRGNPEFDSLVVALQKEGLIGNDAIFFEGYDEAIASAVVGFQQKYSADILTPFNLKYGTGFVGKSTRMKLNDLYGCKKINCQPQWACVWGPCNEGYQSQIVVDKNDCGLLPGTEGCPELAQQCEETIPQGIRQSAITVIWPNGGEILNKGETYGVKWTVDLNSVNTVYLKESGATSCTSFPANLPIPCVYTIGQDLDQGNVWRGGNGKFEWRIQNGRIQGGLAQIPSGRYTIQICTESRDCDESDSPFAIISPSGGLLGNSSNQPASIFSVILKLFGF